jgi:hypothetical protein
MVGFAAQRLMKVEENTRGTIPSPELFATKTTWRWGASMNLLRPTDDLSIFSVGGTGFGDLVTERAADPVNRSHSETDAVKPTLICARITEVRDGQQIDLGGDYHFEQLPARNDQIIILNRRGSYDIMRVLYSAHESELVVYVRWAARR